MSQKFTGHHRHSLRYRTVATARGMRLLQNGAVLSEALHEPGPTHSIFDILGALIHLLAPGPRIAVLGFASGGLMAPLRKLENHTPIEAVDLSLTGYELFQRCAQHWGGEVRFHHAEAGAWLEKQQHPLDLIVEDLSMVHNREAVKPPISWTTLPAQMKQALKPHGIVISNLLTPANPSWKAALPRLSSDYATAHTVLLDDFVNRILIKGPSLPSARKLSTALRHELKTLKSRQADRFRIRTVKG